MAFPYNQDLREVLRMLAGVISGNSLNARHLVPTRPPSPGNVHMHSNLRGENHIFSRKNRDGHGGVAWVQEYFCGKNRLAGTGFL